MLKSLIYKALRLISGYKVCNLTFLTVKKGIAYLQCLKLVKTCVLTASIKILTA
ncbi:uncharacterized protein Thert_02008 [Thermoanaerobacterium thermosaccharolyticum]|uniref:Uncharacterized protein n=1 Tax=Thermoanaerobacterium thermosaccharolyticum TaxID=1517 RepID=A0A223HZR2_THETR|nr:uncharacterized protein Thert_02008 [Thermoanaerobacterium thermosaccharolyticum]